MNASANNKSIVCFGELLIDFLHFNTQDEGRFKLPELRQYPGGAPANVAAALGVLGGNVRFLGQVGNDRFGHFLIDAMRQLNVDVRFLTVHPTAPTPLAFVFLDADGEPTFEFRRDRTADLKMRVVDLDAEAFAGVGLFHFCSNTLTDSRIAETTAAAIDHARRAGAAISFDVNLRPGLWPAGEPSFDRVRAFFAEADFVKASADEARWLLERGFPRREWLRSARAVWITDAGRPIEVLAADERLTVRPPRAEVVDATAGGDAFAAGLLLALNALGAQTPRPLIAPQLRRVTHFAAHCGSVAVSRPGALPSLPTWADVSASWPFPPTGGLA